MDENQAEFANNSEDRFTVVTPDDWNERWKDRRIGFHKLSIHPMLEKHVEKLINNRCNLRIFVPLCGKSLDLKWLADKGHNVVGVEVSDMALKEFFDEQGLEYTIEDAEDVNGKVYKSEKGNIVIYCCDIYNLTKDKVGQFDGIWDRGSFVAINRQDRKKYSDLMKSLMAPGCVYLLDTFDYNENLYPGPPHYVPVEQIYSLFGDSCSIDLVDSFDAFEERHKAWGIDYLIDRLHVMTPKN